MNIQQDIVLPYKLLLELRCISQSPSKSQNFHDSIMILARKRYGLEIRYNSCSNVLTRGTIQWCHMTEHNVAAWQYIMLPCGNIHMCHMLTSNDATLSK
jgi:hypothetical protein